MNSPIWVTTNLKIEVHYTFKKYTHLRENHIHDNWKYSIERWLWDTNIKCQKNWHRSDSRECDQMWYKLIQKMVLFPHSTKRKLTIFHLLQAVVDIYRIKWVIFWICTKISKLINVFIFYSRIICASFPSMTGGLGPWMRSYSRRRKPNRRSVIKVIW